MEADKTGVARENAKASFRRKPESSGHVRYARAMARQGAPDLLNISQASQTIIYLNFIFFIMGHRWGWRIGVNPRDWMPVEIAFTEYLFQYSSRHFSTYG